MKKQFGICIVALFFTGLFLSAAPAKAKNIPPEDVSKEDLYKMILELKEEVRQLKAGSEPVAAPSENEVRAIVREEVAQQTPVAGEASLMDRIQIHGSLSQGYLKSNHNDWLAKTEEGTFNFNEFSINFSANLTDKLRGGLQFMSRDFGSMINNEIRLDWAVMDYAWKDELGLRAGILKVPFGLYNESRDVDSARISVFLPQSFYGENFRDLYNSVMGVGIYGNIDMYRAGILTYIAIYGDQDLDKDGEIVRNAVGRNLLDVGVAEVNATKTAAIGITWDSPLPGMRLNSSYYSTNVTLLGNKTVAPGMTLDGALIVNNFYSWSMGAEYTWNNLVLAAEYREANVPSEFTVGGNLVATVNSTGEYWYLSSAYRFNDWFASEISYSEQYPYADDKEGDRFDGSPGNEKFYAWSKIWSVNARFDINDYWILKAGVNFNNGMAHGFNFENPDGAEEDWILYQLKTTVSF